MNTINISTFMESCMTTNRPMDIVMELERVHIDDFTEVCKEVKKQLDINTDLTITCYDEVVSLIRNKPITLDDYVHGPKEITLENIISYAVHHIPHKYVVDKIKYLAKDKSKEVVKEYYYNQFNGNATFWLRPDLELDKVISVIAVDVINKRDQQPGMQYPANPHHLYTSGTCNMGPRPQPMGNSGFQYRATPTANPTEFTGMDNWSAREHLILTEITKVIPYSELRTELNNLIGIIENTASTHPSQVLTYIRNLRRPQ